jgi:hypothetical protein
MPIIAVLGGWFAVLRMIWNQTRPVRVWLDDEREAPEGWIHARSVDEAKRYLQHRRVVELSLDNDLGPAEPCDTCFDDACDEADGCPCDCHGRLLPEGCKLVDWMEETGKWPKKRPTVHSGNSVRRQYMEKVIEKRYGSRYDSRARSTL